MGCYTVLLGVWFQAFRMILVPPKSMDWVDTWGFSETSGSRHIPENLNPELHLLWQ